MTRALILLLVLPVSAAAQDDKGGPAPASTVVAIPSAGSEVLVAADAAEQTRPPAARQQLGTKRRPSMVGYVGDSTITSQFRIRFDSGFQITSPDRAEFFYAKCGCYRDLPPSLNIFDPDAEGPGPGILSKGDFQQLFVLGEYAIGDRVSVFGELPVRWLKPQEFVAGTGSFDNQSGLSDVRLGAKLGVMSTDSGQATVLVQMTTPTGDSRKGLGTHHASFETALLAAQQVGERVGVEGQFGAIVPIGGSPGIPTTNSEKFSGSVLYYGIGPSVDLYMSDTVRFGPVVELVGWHVMGGFQTLCAGVPCFADASGTNIVNIKIGGRFVMRDRNSIYVGYGKGLTDQKWYDDILRVEFRRSF